MRTDENFNLFWQKIKKMIKQLNVDGPQLARRQKAPRQFEQGVGMPKSPNAFAIQIPSKTMPTLLLKITENVLCLQDKS